eukprot:10272251-Alexandrium_andersonii.AAC.1
MSPQTTTTFDVAASNATAAGANKKPAPPTGAGKGARAPAASAPKGSAPADAGEGADVPASGSAEAQTPATAEQAVKNVAKAFTDANSI